MLILISNNFSFPTLLFFCFPFFPSLFNNEGPHFQHILIVNNPDNRSLFGLLKSTEIRFLNILCNPFTTDVYLSVYFSKSHKIIRLPPKFTILSTSHSPSSRLETRNPFSDSNSRNFKSSVDVYHMNITPILDQLLFFMVVIILGWA